MKGTYVRKLIVLMGLLAVVGVASVPTAGAALGGNSVHGSEVVGTSDGISLLSESQCQQGYMCVWEGTTFYTGNFAAWPGSDFGCHNHENLPKVRSAWNRTGHTVKMGGQGYLVSGERSVYSAPVTGLICW